MAKRGSKAKTLQRAIDQRRSVPISITMQPEVLAKIDHARAELGMNRSQFIVQVVTSFIEQSSWSLRALAKPVVREAFLRAMTTPGVAQGIAQALQHELSKEEHQEVLEFFKSKAKE